MSSPKKTEDKTSPKKTEGKTSPKKVDDKSTTSPVGAPANGSLFSGFGNTSTNIFTNPSASSTGFQFAPATFGSSTVSNKGASPAKTGGDDDEDDGEDAEGGANGNYDADESAAADFKPIVQLSEVQVKTMEEDEDILLKLRAKLFTFVKEDVYGGEVRQNYWKERGLGDVKLLKHKKEGMIRLVMRQEKTLKICANHLIAPTVELKPNVGSDRSWVFTTADFADGEIKTETFAIKFNNQETANQFKQAVDDAKKNNALLMKAHGTDKELAKAVSELTVDEKKKPAIVGGYSPTAVDDDEIVKAGQFAANKIGMGDFIKVAAAQQQVVAGMNYKLTVHIKYSIDNEVHAHSVVVHKPLPHTGEDMILKENSHLGKV